MLPSCGWGSGCNTHTDQWEAAKCAKDQRVFRPERLCGQFNKWWLCWSDCLTQPSSNLVYLLYRLFFTCCLAFFGITYFFEFITRLSRFTRSSSVCHHSSSTHSASESCAPSRWAEPCFLARAASLTPSILPRFSQVSTLCFLMKTDRYIITLCRQDPPSPPDTHLSSEAHAEINHNYTHTHISLCH